MNRTDLQIPEVAQEADKPSFSCSNSLTTQTSHTYVPQRLSLFAARGHGRAIYQSVPKSTAFQNICGHFPIPYFGAGEASDKNCLKAEQTQQDQYDPGMQSNTW
mgnify:CR=1 FL=1